MRIYFFEVEEWEEPLVKEYIEQNKDWDIKIYREPLTGNTVEKAKDADILSVFIYSQVSKEVIDNVPNLKLIVTRSTGFDHIDVEYAKSKGIKIANVPHYGENTVAEHTFALILALSRNIHKTYVRVNQGNFSLKGLMGFDLKGKTLGVIGTGRIGMHVIKIAKGFGMNILAYDAFPNHFMAEFLDFKYVTLEELLKNSDIITIHVPYSKSTHHLINKENIKLVKKGAILINTARGGIVDTEVLYQALEDGTLAGAGLDTFEGEEILKEDMMILSKNYPVEKLKAVVMTSKLIRMENVVFTPHIAFFSKEAIKRIIDTTFYNISGFLNNTHAFYV